MLKLKTFMETGLLLCMLRSSCHEAKQTQPVSLLMLVVSQAKDVFFGSMISGLIALMHPPLFRFRLYNNIEHVTKSRPERWTVMDADWLDFLWS